MSNDIRGHRHSSTTIGSASIGLKGPNQSEQLVLLVFGLPLGFRECFDAVPWVLELFARK
jgi:hypothetical protein